MTRPPKILKVKVVIVDYQWISRANHFSRLEQADLSSEITNRFDDYRPEKSCFKMAYFEDFISIHTDLLIRKEDIMKRMFAIFSMFCVFSCSVKSIVTDFVYFLKFEGEQVEHFIRTAEVIRSHVPFALL